MKITGDLVIFVTGGASGLGEATVRYLHALGCKLGVADRDEDRLELLKKELKANIFCIKCDVTNEEDVKTAVDQTVKTFGTIHAAIACAGVATVCPTVSSRGGLDVAVFKKTIEINVYGSMYVAKYVAPILAKNNPLNDKGERGVMIFVSSVAAEEGQRGQLAYSASKGAINGMMLPMARDLGKFGIRVCAIAPGIF
jgi:3-hydroxyacyl-CoA dehydrogenase/3-hydroxy-2-methylbutyryl-CoA dehydrogenase